MELKKLNERMKEMLNEIEVDSIKLVKQTRKTVFILKMRQNQDSVKGQDQGWQETRLFLATVAIDITQDSPSPSKRSR